MTWNVGDTFIIASIYAIEDDLVGNERDLGDWYTDRDEFMVASIHPDGTINQFGYLDFYDDEGNDIDEPRISGSTMTYDNSDEEYHAYTYDMLADIVMTHNATTPEQVCEKIKFLYRKFNRKGFEFKFQGV